MIPLRIRMIAPITIAITDVSPMVPAIFPISMSMLFTPSSAAFPASILARIVASGVAPDTPSYTKLVILPVKEIRRKHLAPSAGFMKFCPNPPKSCFTTRIANTLPMIPIQIGVVGGRLSASRSPVTAALKSLIVIFLCISFS